MRKNISFERFVRESNMIEGINEVRPGEAEALAEFVDLDCVTIDSLVALVGVFEPTARLRAQSGMDVRVGGYSPPSGGQAILYRLDNLLGSMEWKTPWEVHVEYEMLHPFTDGNGRSGRALWLWKMFDEGNWQWPFKLGFLHSFYYQTLQQEQE